MQTPPFEIKCIHQNRTLEEISLKHKDQFSHYDMELQALRFYSYSEHVGRSDARQHIYFSIEKKPFN